MNGLVMTDWRGQTGWNADIDSGSAVLRFTPTARPIDLLDEEGVVQRPTPVIRAIEVLEMSDDVGRYLPTSFGAVAVPEHDAYLTQAGHSGMLSDVGAIVRLFDSPQDQFLINLRPGDFDDHGPFGSGTFELHPGDGGSEDVMISPATRLASLPDDFIVYPHGEAAIALPVAEGMVAFGADGLEATFGGGDDPLWMLTLLPAPDDLVHDLGFGHPGLGIDPWG